MPAGLKLSEPRSVQFRKWKGVNRTDDRTSIDDSEFSWLENAITVGDGAVQLLPKQGASIATLTPGIATIWGVTLSLGGVATPLLIVVGTDGSLKQAKTDGTTTVIAAAGTVTTSAHVTIFRTSPVLIVDQTKGYFTWDGAVFTVVDATKVGVSVAVFEGRVWIANGRTITFTAPNSATSFVAGDGAGSVVLTDEAFHGNIVDVVSALEQLWIIGNGAIDAISNVQASGVSPNVVTTFTITNIVTNVGAAVHAVSIGYFRALTFLSPVGVYALVGVTPQKLSDKLDGLFPQLTVTAPSVALFVVQNLLCLGVLVTYTGGNSTQGAGNVSLVLGFNQGKWFFAFQGPLVWITTLISTAGITQAWGTDGSTIYQLFGAAASTAVPYKVQWKLSDFGSATTAKMISKVGFEFQASQPITPTITVDSEISSVTASLAQNNTLVFTGVGGAVITFVGTGAISWTSQGLLLTRATASQAGRYLGWTVSGNDAPYRLQAVEFEITATREWQGTMP